MCVCRTREGKRETKSKSARLFLKIPSCCEVSVSRCRDVAVFSSRELKKVSTSLLQAFLVCAKINVAAFQNCVDLHAFLVSWLLSWSLSSTLQNNNKLRGMPSSQYLRDLVTSSTTTARGSSFASTSYDARERRGCGGGGSSGSRRTMTTTTTTTPGEFFHHHHHHHHPASLFIPSAKENSATTASAAAATTTAAATAAAGKAGVSPAIKAISGSFGGIIEVR